MCYKILTNKIKIEASDFFTKSELPTRGHQLKILKTKRSIKQLRCQSFSIRTVNEWNALSPHVIDADTVNTFKNRLDKYWKWKILILYTLRVQYMSRYLQARPSFNRNTLCMLCYVIIITLCITLQATSNIIIVFHKLFIFYRLFPTPILNP